MADATFFPSTFNGIPSADLIPILDELVRLLRQGPSKSEIVFRHIRDNPPFAVAAALLLFHSNLLLDADGNPVPHPLLSTLHQAELLDGHRARSARVTRQAGWSEKEAALLSCADYATHVPTGISTGGTAAAAAVAAAAAAATAAAAQRSGQRPLSASSGRMTPTHVGGGATPQRPTTPVMGYARPTTPTVGGARPMTPTVGSQAATIAAVGAVRPMTPTAGGYARPTTPTAGSAYARPITPTAASLGRPALPMPGAAAGGVGGAGYARPTTPSSYARPITPTATAGAPASATYGWPTVRGEGVAYPNPSSVEMPRPRGGGDGV